MENVHFGPNWNMILLVGVRGVQFDNDISEAFLMRS